MLSVVFKPRPTGVGVTALPVLLTMLGEWVDDAYVLKRQPRTPKSWHVGSSSRHKEALSHREAHCLLYISVATVVYHMASTVDRRST